MSKSSQAVITWRKRTKERIIEAMGGKCSECGYTRCSGAFDLHHLDPSKKKFSFGGIRARPKSWKTIVEELKKCILVCANCHREIEDGMRIPQNITTTFNEDFEQYTALYKNSRPQSEYKHKVICRKCNVEFEAYRVSAKYCSEVCRRNK